MHPILYSREKNANRVGMDANHKKLHTLALRYSLSTATRL